MKILVATDAWGQTNGVVFAYQRIAEPLREFGAHLAFVTPEGFRSAPLPTYPDIRLAFASSGEVGRRIDRASPDHIHIATEGPIGWATRRYCLENGTPFTTSYHTRFPEYVAARLPFAPLSWSYAYLKRFHSPAERLLAPTPSMKAELERRGFSNVVLWTRGVDHSLFRPRKTSLLDLPRPIFLNVGRVAVEKNLKAFLDLDLPGSKVIIGDGPARRRLQRDLSRSAFPRRKVRRGAGGAVRERGRLRVPLAHRHLWGRADRSAWRAACRSPPIPSRDRWT